jgi:hypothetical protein
MINERSVYPELAFWTRSTQVLLMSILGGVYTFFGPIVGAFMPATDGRRHHQGLSTDLATLPRQHARAHSLWPARRIMGFIQARDTASTDDAATRVHKAMGEFSRKFWYFFAATLFFTAFFRILQAPDTWKTTVLLTAAQAIIGGPSCVRGC